MESTPKQSNVSVVRGVQKQIQAAYLQNKYSYCIQLIDYAIDLLKSNGCSSITLSNLEIDIRSFKAYLCYTHFPERIPEAEEQFSVARSIDPLHPLLLKRKIECYLRVQCYNKALECCTDLLLNEPENTWARNIQEETTNTLLETEEKSSDVEKNKGESAASPGTLKIIEFRDLENDDVSAEIRNSTDQKSVKSKSILKDSSSFTSGISTQYITDEMNTHKKQSFSLKKLKFLEKGLDEKADELDDIPDGDGKGKFKKQLSMYQKQVSKDMDDEQVLSSHQKVEKKPTLKKSKSVAFRNQEYKQ